MGERFAVVVLQQVIEVSGVLLSEQLEVLIVGNLPKHCPDEVLFFFDAILVLL
jgi:hypothetical protein